MADFSSTTDVDTDAESLYAYLSDVGNLPEYFAQMTSARSGEGEQVHTTATLPDGSEVEGDAWFRTDDGARTVEWGSEGPSAYGGRLEVTGQGGGSRVTVHLHTTRGDSDPDQVQQGLDGTTANIKRLVEQRGRA